MSVFLLPCECGSDIRVTKAQAGGTVTCPACRREATAPRFRELSRLEVAGAAAVDRGPRAGRPWTLFHTLLLAGTLIAASCALGSVSFVPPEVEMFDGGTIRDSVLQAPTDEVLSVLRTRLVPSGVDRPPTEMEAKTRARSDFYYSLRDGLRIAAAIGALAALIGGLGIIFGGRGAGGGGGKGT